MGSLALRRVVAICAAISVASGALAASAVTAAPVAAETTHQRSNYEALFADAIFQIDDGDIRTDVDVQVITGHIKGGFVDDTGTPVGYEDYQAPVAFVDIVQYRLPEFEPIFRAVALVEVTDDQAWIDQQLRSAWLRADVVATDVETGAAIPVSIDIAWSVDGQFVRDSGRYRQPPPDKTVFHVVSKARDGEITAAGRVVLAGENLTPEPTNIGFVMRVNGFQMLTTRTGTAAR